jgi:hypothetical protein
LVLEDSNESIQEMLGFPNGFKFKDIKYNISKEKEKIKKNVKKSIEKYIQKNNKNSKKKGKSTKKKKYHITSKTKAMIDMEKSLEKMRQNDELFTSNRNALGSKKSKKKLKVLNKTKKQKKKRSKKIKKIDLMPELNISLSSNEELISKQKELNDRMKNVMDSNEEILSGTLDSTQLKIVRPDLNDNMDMDDFFGPLDIKRTRIDSVRNTGLLCRECVQIASQAHQKGEGVHIPRCKTKECVNYRANKANDNFDFSEIEELEEGLGKELI